MSIPGLTRTTGFEEVDNWLGWVVGADEAGWGAMAGPLVVAAIAAPISWNDPRVTDSKALTPKKRETLFREYMPKRDQFKVSVVMVPSTTVDEGPQRARVQAFSKAINEAAGRCPHPPLVVVDGDLRPPVEVEIDRVVCYPKADLKVPEVSLASIFAKVGRDLYMTKLHAQYPQYDWAKNKGYVTKDHMARLEKHGPCEQHRVSYSPVARVIAARKQADDVDDDDFRAALGLK